MTKICFISPACTPSSMIDAIRSGITISMATSRIMNMGVTRDARLYSLICLANVLIIADFLSAFLLKLFLCNFPVISLLLLFYFLDASFLFLGRFFFISWLLLCCFCFFCSDKYSVICLSGITAVITHFGMVRWNFPHAHRPFPDSASSYLK